MKCRWLLVKPTRSVVSFDDDLDGLESLAQG